MGPPGIRLRGDFCHASCSIHVERATKSGPHPRGGDEAPHFEGRVSGNLWAYFQTLAFLTEQHMCLALLPQPSPWPSS